MHKFLTQFALTPMQRLDLETFIFNQASRMIEGYNGGFWETVLLGNKHIVIIPVSGDNITITNYVHGGSITTDAKTASVIFNSMVTNWYMNLRAEQGRISDATIEAIDNFGQYLSQQAKNLPNPRDFYSFTD